MMYVPVHQSMQQTCSEQIGGIRDVFAAAGLVKHANRYHFSTQLDFHVPLLLKVRLSIALKEI